MKDISKAFDVSCFWLAEGEKIESPARGCDVFKYVPTLLASMESLWDGYENFDLYKWNEGATKEKVRALYIEMYFCFRRLNFVGLQIIWYLHCVLFPTVSGVLRSLQSAYDSLCSARNMFGLKAEHPLTACKRIEDE